MSFDPVVALSIISHIIALASVAVQFTKTPKDDAVLAKIVKVLEFLALNKRS